MKFFSEILETRLSYGKNPKSLSHLASDWYQLGVTDGHQDRQQDRITIANTRYSSCYASSRV